MRYSLRTVIIAALFGTAFGFGTSYWTTQSSDHFARSVDAPPVVTPIASDPIVSIAALTADDGRATKIAAEENKKSNSAPPPKASVRQKSANTVVKQFEEIRKLPTDRRDRQKENELFEQWIKVDPAGASVWSADNFAAGGDEEFLRKAVQSYARRDPWAAATWASMLPSPLVRDSALREVFEAWASRDPRRAAEMVALLPIGTAQSTAATVVGKHYSRSDFEASLAWMGSLAAPAQASAFQSIMRTQWTDTGSTNPAATLPWLLSQASLSFREQGIRFIATEWSKRDPLAALSHAAIISNRPDRNLFVETALRTYTQTNPREAAFWLANQPATAETERLMHQVMTAWTAFEPWETARWAGDLQNSSLRTKSITAVAESWAKVDPDGLAQWIDSLPDTTSRDAAVEGATRVWMRNDPAGAAQWATSIDDRRKRDYRITQIVYEWKNHDEGAALTFVRTTPVLEEDLRKRLLQ